ncbi:hypothetical protein Aab01nite_05950 [Paractinoplanes abujensis]|nr:hypothetical protein Aab01nite_05950 [Actinoplanes abujensis]
MSGERRWAVGFVAGGGADETSNDRRACLAVNGRAVKGTARPLRVELQGCVGELVGVAEAVRGDAHGLFVEERQEFDAPGLGDGT